MVVTNENIFNFQIENVLSCRNGRWVLFYFFLNGKKVYSVNCMHEPVAILKISNSHTLSNKIQNSQLKLCVVVS